MLSQCLSALQEQARKAWEAQQEAWDKESSILEQQQAALAKGGAQADAVVKQIAAWQASLPQAEQSLVQAPKGMLSFPVTKTRGASAMNGAADRGSNKKKAKEDAPQAELQRTQIKNPVQVAYVVVICLHLHGSGCPKPWQLYVIPEVVVLPALSPVTGCQWHATLTSSILLCYCVRTSI